MRIFLSLIGVILLGISQLFAQPGYTLQVAAYTAPMPLAHFESLRLPVQQVEAMSPTGEPCFLYVVDDFATYTEADKARRLAVANDFPDAIPVKTSTDRSVPHLRILPAYNPTTGGINPTLLENGYTLQVATFSAPAPLRYFSDLNLPLRQVSGVQPTGAAFYLYVVDGFETYADADRARRAVVSHGFADAIALKTPSSRKPAMRVALYKGPSGGEPVPAIE